MQTLLAQEVKAFRSGALLTPSPQQRSWRLGDKGSHHSTTSPLADLPCMARHLIEFGCLDLVIAVSNRCGWTSTASPPLKQQGHHMGDLANDIADAVYTTASSLGPSTRTKLIRRMDDHMSSSNRSPKRQTLGTRSGTYAACIANEFRFHILPGSAVQTHGRRNNEQTTRFWCFDFLCKLASNVRAYIDECAVGSLDPCA